MSNDEHICNNLIHTLEDGKNGFESAAAKLADDGRPDVAAKFAFFATERREMATELERIAASYGDDPAKTGTVTGAVHRGWMGLKDALTGKDPDSVIASAERGEDHAMEQYRDAVKADISPEFKAIVTRQMTKVEQAHDYVSTLKKSA